MLIKNVLISVVTVISLLISSISASIAANFQEQQQEESSSTRDEIPELRERNYQSPLKKFKNQADPEEVPFRSTDPVQGSCDREKTKGCDKKPN